MNPILTVFHSPLTMVLCVSFILVLMLAALVSVCRRALRMHLSEIRLGWLTLKIENSRLDAAEIIQRIYRNHLSPAGNSVELRIDRSLLKTLLHSSPDDIELHELLVKVEDALNKTPPFLVRRDQHVQQLGLAVTAALWILFAFLDLVLWGVDAFITTLLTYPVAALLTWCLATVQHEYGHFCCVRELLRDKLGIVTPRLWLFRFTKWGTSFTGGGLLKLVFLLRAGDTILDVDHMVETIISDTASLRVSGHA